MPTHDEELQFRNEYKRLSAQQRALFDSAIRQMVKDLKAKRPFNPSLRVKPVQGHKGVFEMTGRCIMGAQRSTTEDRATQEMCISIGGASTTTASSSSLNAMTHFR